MDLNLMPQEEEHEAIDLNLMPQKEDGEGINLNWIPEEEERLVADNRAMDLNYDPDKLHRSFITLEAVMFEVMKDKGGNQYKLPHLHKDRFQNAGMEITGVYCDSRVVVDTRAVIEKMEIAIGKENERKELAREGKRKKSKGKGRSSNRRDKDAPCVCLV